MSSEATEAFIGVDVGGTHTDVQVAIGANLVRGKALTTYDDFSRGVLEAIEVAAGELGLELQELLARTQLIVNGTTVVTNAITEMRGSRVGVIVTAGFKDTLRIGGGPRRPVFDDHLQVNMPDIAERRAIVEVEGRIDYSGKVLVALNEEQVMSAARYLMDEVSAEALAICFLSSYVNPEHELRAESIVRRLYPDVFVSLSHQVYRLQGENRRWTTAVLNSFVQAPAKAYLDSLSTRLKDAGLAGSVAFFQGLGGGISRERAERLPLALLGSGPAGGEIGANTLAQHMGAKNVLIGDMGGTSFDTGMIRDNELHIEKNIEIGPFQTGVNLVDVI